MNYNIQTEEDYRRALKRFLEICTQENSDEYTSELFVLMDEMARYERRECCSN